MTSLDREKYLHAKLIERSLVFLQCGSVLETIKLPEGVGLTGHFVRYDRLNVPMVSLTEGSLPDEDNPSVSEVQVVLDQMGGRMTLSDIAMLATKHPLVEEATKLLADQAQRVIDREIQKVFLAGTNVQYFDGSRADRTEITTSDKLNDTVLHKARVTLVNDGTPPRGGPGGGVQLGQGVEKAGSGVMSAKGNSATNGKHFVAICGPEVMADMRLASTTLGTFVSVAMYRDQSRLYNYEMGEWLGFRWIETNFIPKFNLLGNTTEAVSSASAFGTDTPVVTAVNGSGSLKSATTFFYKVTRKHKLRGFEEDISIAHSTASEASGDNESFTFNFTGVDDDYVYNLYFDTEATGGDGSDGELGLAEENIESGDTVTVTTVATGDAPPSSVCDASDSNIATVHPIYICGEDFGSWVHLDPLKVIVTGDQATIGGNELLQKKSIGWKYLGKAVIKDQLRILRVEVHSGY